MGAISSLLDCVFLPGCAVRILGGSEEQSQRMYDYLRAAIDSGFADHLEGRVTAKGCSFVNDSNVQVLLIADEVATGFGRTGKMFACDHEGVTPDLLCLSKGLTGGYLPLAATLATESIYQAFLGPIDSGKTFYHGHTFTGNPLGCAAALASLDLFESDHLLATLPAKIERLGAHLSRIAGSPHVGDVRQQGLIAGIEIVRDKTTREAYPYALQVGAQVCARALADGVILRPLADTIVIMPPLIIAPENLDHLLKTVERCIDEVVPNVTEGISNGLE